jgi:tRNA G18 (ribose-2'-O)-methylase SpoU
VVVEDPSDPRLADYFDLADPAGRRRVEAERAIIVVEGRLPVHRLLESDARVRSLLIDERRAVTASDLVDAVAARGAPVYVGRRELVEATVGFPLHRGVVAIAERPPEADAGALLAAAVRGPAPRVVAVLEGLNDHENLGALFRNAAAFGVAAVLLDPTCADPLYRRSIRVSVGHVLQVPSARLTPWPEALGTLRAAGFVLAAMTPHPPVASGEGRPATDLAGLGATAPGRPVALLFGAEGAGLSAAALEAADRWVSIPMSGRVDSLNVAVAAAVAFHALGTQGAR